MMRVDDTSRPPSLSEIASGRAPSHRVPLPDVQAPDLLLENVPAVADTLGMPASSGSGRASLARRGFLPLLLIAVACGPLLAQEADRTRTEALSRRAGDRLQSLQQ